MVLMYRLRDTGREGFHFGIIAVGGVRATREQFYDTQTWCTLNLPEGSWHAEQWTIVVHAIDHALAFKMRWC